MKAEIFLCLFIFDDSEVRIKVEIMTTLMATA